jgi:hypothetical protein
MAQQAIEILATRTIEGKDYHKGQRIQLAPQQAKALIRTGYARYVPQEEPKAARKTAGKKTTHKRA